MRFFYFCSFSNFNFNLVVNPISHLLFLLQFRFSVAFSFLFYFVLVVFLFWFKFRFPVVLLRLTVAFYCCSVLYSFILFSVSFPDLMLRFVFFRFLFNRSLSLFGWTLGRLQCFPWDYCFVLILMFLPCTMFNHVLCLQVGTLSFLICLIFVIWLEAAVA